MMTPSEDEIYKVTRMVPQIPFKYYFTLNGVTQYSNITAATESTKEIKGVPYTYIYDEHTNKRHLLNDEYFQTLR